MQHSAVLLARVFVFIESADLNPRGAAFYPDVIRALVDRYNFQKFPQKFEDFDENKGVEFQMGRIHNQTIDKVVIYSHGIALDTASSTEQSEEILEEALTWCASTLGLYFRPEMVRRKAYVSQVTFYSDAPLLFVNPVLKELSEEIGKIVSGNLKLESVYEPSGIVLSLDPETQRVPSSPFSIERRQGIAFSEDKYFSVAPLPTDIHLGMLEEYERRIVQQWKK